MFRSLKSAFVAFSLAAAVFTGTTVTSAIIATPAEAGIVSSIKGAAKAVGRGIEKGAKAVGGGAATIGRGLGHDAKLVGKAIARGPLGNAAKSFGRGIAKAAKQAAPLVNRYVLHRR